jgi:uroporphyrin-3 C-methyltransferase
MTSDSDKPNNQDQKDIELNEAFARLEKQVEENQAKESKPQANEPAPRARPSRPLSNDRSNNQTQKSGGGVLSILALLIAFAALGAGSYGAYTSYLLTQQNQASSDGLTALSTELRRVESQLNSFEAWQFSPEALIDAEFRRFAEQQNAAQSGMEARVAASISELRQQIGTTSEDWLLAEAEYLLRLANQRILMEDDVTGAISLFEAADNIINDAEGVVAFSLRAAIADDVAALKAVSAADIDGIYVQLGALAKQIPLLEQKQLKFEPQVPEFVAPDAELAGWRSFVQLTERVATRVASLVDYRRDGEVVTPILPPKEEYYLKQNLLLKIQLGQLGLLRGDQEIFAQSLVDATAWVRDHFDPAENRTISMIATLESLSALQIEREIPDVSSSLREIRKLMANFHQTAERTAKQTEPPAEQPEP